MEYFHLCKWNVSLTKKIPQQEFEDRLRAVIGEATIEEFARTIEEPAQRVKDILRKKQKPPSDFLVKLQLKLGVDLNWLLAGGSEPLGRALSVREAALLDDYRAADDEGQRAIAATGAAVAKTKQRKGEEESMGNVQRKIGRKAA